MSTLLQVLQHCLTSLFRFILLFIGLLALDTTRGRRPGVAGVALTLAPLCSLRAWAADL